MCVRERERGWRQTERQMTSDGDSVRDECRCKSEWYQHNQKMDDGLNGLSVSEDHQHGRSVKDVIRGGHSLSAPTIPHSDG